MAPRAGEVGSVPPLVPRHSRLPSLRPCHKNIVGVVAVAWPLACTLPALQSCAGSTCPQKLSSRDIWQAGARSEVLSRRPQYLVSLLRPLIRRHFAPASSSVYGTDGGLDRLRARQTLSTIGSMRHSGGRIDCALEASSETPLRHTWSALTRFPPCLRRQG
jgi:hypothetical protein